MDIKRVNLLDESAFATCGGLWTGKKGPFVTATVIRSTNFTASGRVDYADTAVLKVEEKQLASRRLIPGDIIIERSGGGPSQPVGRVVFFEREDGVFSHSNFTSRLRVVDAARFEARFVFYFLLYFHYSGQTDHLQRRTTGIRNLNWQAYRENASVPLFDLFEQHEIAAVLSAVQRAIGQQEQLIALATELKKALMQKLFTEGTHGERQKQTEIGPVPESWDLMKLKSCCAVHSGYAFKSDDYVTRSEGVAIIKIGDIRDGEVLISDKTSYVPQEFWADSRLAQFRLDRGALLIALTGATTGKVGQFDSDERAFLNQRVGRFILDKQRLGLTFLRFLVLQPYFQRNIKANILVAAQGNISPKSIENFVVALPKPEEQVTIANTLLCVDRRIATARALHHQLGELFRTLLHKLMTAQIRVHDLNLSALEKAEREPVGEV